MIASNHEVILGDQPRKVEIDSSDKVVSEFKKEFKIGAKDTGASAMVFLAVKGLVGDAEPVDVDINGKSIGRLMPNHNANPDSWFVHMLHFSQSEGSLKPNEKDSSEVNTIQIPGMGTKLKPCKLYVQNICVLYKAVIE